MKNENEELICGKNAVLEAISSGRELNCILIKKGPKNGTLGRIFSSAKQKNILVKETDTKKLDLICGGASHQGVAAYCASTKYCSVEDILLFAEEKGEQPFVIILDNIEDPHNLGAIIRSAEASGAHGVIIPKRHGAAVTWVVGKASAGAVEHMKIARVTNIASTIDLLKAKGLWIYCADMDGQRWCDANLSGAIGLVIGNEGKGVSKLAKEKCDFVLSLPMLGKVSSLNASVAAGILMYEVVRTRLNK